MSYLVFARKFRPQTFEEVVGQEPITTTLKNAISKDRIAQSFLFTGSRGVGKTSTARILAKALNCAKGPAPEPCNKCASCDEITRGTSLDILEIDGASNRGIDEIRNLRENIKFKPASGRYKIYIIDEVHMLTGEAFNALLKTLEEPPVHVKFIFATTESHKVPLTILSRCQRFNFKRIPTEDIAKTLSAISKKEKLKASDETLYVIAKAAEGSLRDAESLLDQLASFSEGKIEAEDVVFALGLTEDELYFKLIHALKDRDAKSALQTIHEISESGRDLTQFAKGLLEIFRDLLVITAAEKVSDKLIEASEEHKKELQKLKAAFSKEELLFSLTLLQILVRDLRWSNIPKFLIEATILKMIYRSDLRPIDDVIKELKSLEGKAPGSSAASYQAPSAPASFSRPAEKSAPMPAAPAREPEKADKKKENPRTEVPQAVRVLDNEQSVSLKPKGEPVTFEEVERVWPDLLERVKAVKMSCGTYLAEATPLEVVDNIAVFGMIPALKFHKESLETTDNKTLVRSTLVTLIGRDVNISYIITETEKKIETKAAAADNASTPVSDAHIITSALDIFSGAKIIRREA